MLNRRISFARSPQSAADRLVHGDNLPVLEALEDASVDLIYVDPPFGTGSVRKGRAIKQGDAAAAYKDVPNDPERFVDWIQPRLEHFHRVLASHGSLFMHLDYRAVHYVKVALDRVFGRSRFINEIIWCYSVGGKSKRTYARKHDTILWYGRTADYAFYPDAIRVPRKPNSHMRVVTTEDGELVQEKTDRKTGKVYRYPVNLGKVPEDWWADIETLNRADKERTGWPNQKPERLLERIIAGASAEGNLIADFFCGSATTAVVAQRLDRNFIAVDTEANAIDCAASRLEQRGNELAAAGTPPRDIDVERVATAVAAAS